MVSQEGSGLWLIPQTPCLISKPLTCVLSLGRAVISEEHPELFGSLGEIMKEADGPLKSL